MLKGRSAIVTPVRPAVSVSASRADWRRPGANVVINGFGKPEDIEKERAGPRG